MKLPLLGKIGLAVAVPVVAAAAATGIALVATGGGQSSPNAHGSKAAVAASPSTSTTAGNGQAPAQAGPTAAVPDSNSAVVTDDGNKDAIDRFGQEQFNKAIQTADMFVGLSHGDCNRLAGKSDPIVAMTTLLTPDALGKFTDPSKVLWTPPAGMTFPDKGCAWVGQTTWTAKVEGTEDPVLWLTGTAVTTMRPTSGNPFKITQKIELGLVSMPEAQDGQEGSVFGWQANDLRIAKAQTSSA